MIHTFLSGLVVGKSAFYKLLIFGMLMVLSTIVFLFLGSLILLPIYGIETLTSPNLHVSSDVDFLKYMQAISQVGMFVIPAIVFAWLVEKKVFSFFQLDKKPSVYMLVLLIFLLLSLVPVINYLTAFNNELIFPPALKGLEEWLRTAEMNNNKVIEAFTNTHSISGLLFNILLIGLLTSIAEELVFRGVLFSIFKQWTKNVHLTVFMTALLFTLIHMQFLKFLPMLLMGVLLGYLVVWSGSLWLSIVFHFLNNSFAVLMMYLSHTGVPIEVYNKIGTRPQDNMTLWMSIVFILYISYRLILLGRKQKSLLAL